MLTTALTLRIVVILLSSNLAKLQNPSMEKNSPFECGFNPSYKTRVPFSLQFFLIALIFIIFDVEIILIIPSPLFLFKSHIIRISVFRLIFIVTLGLLHE